MRAWIIIAVIGLGTFLTRFAFIGLFGKAGVPSWLERWLRYVPAAVLSSLVVTTLAEGDQAGPLAARIGAALLGVLVAWRTHNVALTVIAALPALWALNAII